MATRLRTRGTSTPSSAPTTRRATTARKPRATRPCRRPTPMRRTTSTASTAKAARTARANQASTETCPGAVTGLSPAGATSRGSEEAGASADSVGSGLTATVLGGRPGSDTTQ